jgi:WD40 repeat protein
MAMVVRCPNKDCGKPCRISEQHLGRTVQCPHCRQPLAIPAPAKPPLDKPANSTPAAGERSTTPATAPPTLEDVAREQAARETPPLPSPPPSAPPAPPSPPRDLPERIGRFQVRARLGAGSFGAVYLVYDPQLDREMALKVPQPGTLQNPQALERFLREARAAGRLNHPHIVPVYEAGGGDGQGDPAYYIASAYIPGRTLEQALADGAIDFRQAARVAQALAEALAYAHGLGIVHRDVKPSNVLLDEQGEAFLMDFGLAHRLYAATKNLTHAGMVLGTPAYMAPEQAAGRQGAPLPASDQYSLGAVLYEMLTGHTPFSGTPQVVLYHTLHSTPPAPRSLNPTIPPELERICLKAMARQPEERYSTCQELAEDLRRWLEVPASPAPAPVPAPPPKGRRWRRAVVAGLVLVLLASTAWAGWLASQYRADARRARANADLVRYRRLVLLAGQEWLANNGARAEELLDACPESRRDWEWHYLKNLARFATHTLSGHAGPVTCVAFSADGKRVVSGGSDRTARVWDTATGKELLTLRGFARPVRAVAFSPNGKQIVTATGAPWSLSPILPPIAPAVGVWHEPRILSENPSAPPLRFGEGAGGRGSSSSQPPRRFGAGDQALVFSLSPLREERERFTEILTTPEQMLAQKEIKKKLNKEAPLEQEVPRGRGDVRLWDVETGREVLRLAGPADAVESIVYSPDGMALALGSNQGIVEQWDLKTNKRTRGWQNGGNPVVGLAYSSDGTWLAFGNGYEVRAGKREDATSRVLGTLNEPVRTVAIDPDGERVAAVGQRGTLRAWQLKPEPEKEKPKTRLRPAGNGDRRLALAGGWQLPRQEVLPIIAPRNVWSAAPLALDRRFADDEAGISAAALAADGQRVAAAWGGLWGPATLTLSAGHTAGELQALRGHAGVVTALAFSPDGQTLVSASIDGTVKLWQAARWLDLPLLEAPPVTANGAAFSGDGKLLAIVGRHDWGRSEQSLKVWDARSGLQLTLLGQYEAVAFSPNGRRVAVAGGNRAPDVQPKEDKKTDKDTSLPRVDRWQESFVLASDRPGEPQATAPADQPTPLVPDERLGGEAGVVLLVDLDSGQRVRGLRGHKEPAGRLVFSADGRRLAALCQRSVMREVIRVETKEVPQVETRTRKVFRDGKVVQEQYTETVVVRVPVAVKSIEKMPVGDGEVHVWDVATGRLIRSLPRQSGILLAAAFCADGERLAVSIQTEGVAAGDPEQGPPGEIKVWDLESGKEVCTIACEDWAAYDLCSSPDGRRLAATAGQRVHVWDATDGELLFTLSGQRQFFSQVSFSPNGERLVTVARAGSHMEVRAWDASDGSELVVVERFPAIANGLALTFATDCNRILFAGKDQRGLLQLWAWDGTPLETREPLPRPPVRLWGVPLPGGGAEVIPAPADPKKMPEDGDKLPPALPPDNTRAVPKQGSTAIF